MNVFCLYDQLVPIKDLKSHPKNSNFHPQEQITRLAKILDKNGWRYPVKVSKLSGYVTSGHGRIEAAKANGWDVVPVNFQDYENEALEFADVTADNSIANWAELDLSKINEWLPDFGPDLDIELLGLKDFVIDTSEFSEPSQKADPALKEPQLKLCPNCGVVIENG